MWSRRRRLPTRQGVGFARSQPMALSIYADRRTRAARRDHFRYHPGPFQVESQYGPTWSCNSIQPLQIRWIWTSRAPDDANGPHANSRSAHSINQVLPLEDALHVRSGLPPKDELRQSTSRHVHQDFVRSRCMTARFHNESRCRNRGTCRVSGYSGSRPLFRAASRRIPGYVEKLDP
jgi:hypothetical protein